jgi:hypothetical protein
MASKLAFIWVACLENPARTVTRKSLNVGHWLDKKDGNDYVGGLNPPINKRAQAISVLQRHASALPAKAQLAAAYYVLRGYGYMDGLIPNSLFNKPGVHGYNSKHKDGTVKSELKGVFREFPRGADTMHTLSQLFQIQYLLDSTIGAGVPGNFMQAGVWRGGGCVAAALALQVLQPGARTPRESRPQPAGAEWAASALRLPQQSRSAPPATPRVWLADSYAGLPRAATASDKDFWSQIPELAVLAAGESVIKSHLHRHVLKDTYDHGCY